MIQDFNYGFHKEEDIEDFQKIPEVINLAQYDYSFVRNDGDDKNLPELISTTELASFQNLEDMEEFYRQKHPNFLMNIMALWLVILLVILSLKKKLKIVSKRLRKILRKSLPVGMSVAHGDYTH